MSDQHSFLLSCFDVPNNDRAVFACGSEPLAVWGKRHRSYRSYMSREVRDRLAFGDVPDEDRAIGVSSYKPSAIGRKSETPHFSSMFQPQYLGSRRRIP